MKKILLAIAAMQLIGCASVPPETVTLSQTLGNDIRLLRTSHYNAVQLNFEHIRQDINTFIDETYAPFVIQFVLRGEQEAAAAGEHSIFTVLNNAAEAGGAQHTEAALEEMSDFVMAAREQIEIKRKELLNPITAQEALVLGTLEESYNNAINANNAVTGYLQSLRDLKDAQSAALADIGLTDTDIAVSRALIKISQEVSSAVDKAQEIDIKTNQAEEKILEVSEKIKNLTSKIE